MMWMCLKNKVKSIRGKSCAGRERERVLHRAIRIRTGARPQGIAGTACSSTSASSNWCPRSKGHTLLLARQQPGTQIFFIDLVDKKRALGVRGRVLRGGVHHQ